MPFSSPFLVSLLVVSLAVVISAEAQLALGSLSNMHVLVRAACDAWLCSVERHLKGSGLVEGGGGDGGGIGGDGADGWGGVGRWWRWW